ncbi:NucA/NucB deoxyribonuclease domain-containing protein [Lentzea guizhouensis]|uniref:NucA/NucB deoxyribonuclease domain-containing protein n=1 Tax=Lentzea guizhouensis TaxID=1586287 RepID=UPI0014736C50|nr:NucA/NucB deoxyribonuclease domain-containing protein [Lentzea guizhouensis]
MADHATGTVDEVGASKPATPLPEVPNRYDITFAEECRKPENADKAQTPGGWTVNHYKWCRAVNIVWQRIRFENGKPKIIREAAIDTTWLGHADARNRKFAFFSKTGRVVETVGNYEDDAKVLMVAECSSAGTASSCTSHHIPASGVSIRDIKEERNNYFETVITDTSKENFNLPGDAVAPLNTWSQFRGFGGTGHLGDDVAVAGNIISSRCDSAKFRTTNACIFNNVTPFLTFDKNDLGYPVGELVDHIRYAQDVLHAPGRFKDGKPDGPPLTRNRSTTRIQENRNAARAICRRDNPTGWKGTVVQCDEYPMASTYEGANSGGPHSAKLINARHNREGGTQLSNWYEWDRVLDRDKFYVELRG